MDHQATGQKQMWQTTLAGLFDLWRIFQMRLHPDDLAHRILEAVMQATNASRASLMLLDDDEQVLSIKAAAGIAPEVVAVTRVRLGEGIAGWVAQSRRPLLIPDEGGAHTSVQEVLLREEIASALSLPLEAEGHMLGVLNLARLSGGQPFTQRDLWFASLIAERVAAALQSARLHNQLERRERFITRILESIPSSMVVIDRTLRIVSVNRNFLEKTHRETRTTIGRKIEEVFPRALLEYTQLDKKLREIFRTGRPIEGGKLAYRAPGLSPHIYFYRLIPLKEDETVENAMLLMDDITEREQLGEEVRRAERHLASVVECANDLVISMDPQGHILTWNRAVERTSGLTARQIKEQPLLSFCAADEQLVMADILKRLARGERVQNTEVNLLTATGQRVPIAWSCSPMTDDTGRVVGIVAVGRDLTERRELEAQLVQSAKMASLGVLAGGIAHELRNPLGIIYASAQFLIERPDEAELRNECAHNIHSATQRASVIIENLLKFASPHRNQAKEVNLNGVLQDTSTLLSHHMVLQRVTLRKDLQPDLPQFCGNPELLQQVFTNIILNACNAMPQGGILTVATLARGNQIEIKFSDTGRGIAPEHLPKIFDPFFTTMPVGKGTGLGLSISYSIIQQHKGTIHVESQVGQGTSFTIRLPASPNGNKLYAVPQGNS
jgi:PAS domain S-box-containing protein